MRSTISEQNPTPSAISAVGWGERLRSLILLRFLSDMKMQVGRFMIRKALVSFIIKEKNEIRCRTRASSGNRGPSHVLRKTQTVRRLDPIPLKPGVMWVGCHYMHFVVELCIWR